MDVKMFMMLILYHLLNGRMKCSNQIQKLLIEQILTCIQQQRDNMIVDTNLISSAIKSLVFLSIDIQDLKTKFDYLCKFI